jgi:two-component system, OmpR family, response regulator
MHRGTLLRILCVEDEADIQTVMRIALESVGGFQLMVCGSGHDALRAGPAFAPDLILLDVMMPGIDGPATLEAMRKTADLKDTPIVFMTAKVQTHEVEHYRKLGAVDVIAKPFDAMTLSDTLRGIWASIPQESP